MSGMLVADLVALSSETKRRNPDVRHACDAALTALRTEYESALSRSACDTASDPLENLLLRPMVLACGIKSPKVLTLGIALLQRVVAMRVVSDAALPSILAMLPSLAQRSTDVDVQLKLLQTVGSLITTYPQIHNAPLADLLRICFAYQDGAKVALVSSTAAATLRSAIMALLDKVTEEDARLDSIKGGGEEAAAAAPLAAMSVTVSGLPDPVTLFPCSKDAYLVISDLNHLAQGEFAQAQFLDLSSAPKITFCLELLESVLTYHSRLFQSPLSWKNTTDNGTFHPELKMVLKDMTCPLLIGALSTSHGIELAGGGLSFSIQVRLVRLLFLLLRKFSRELPVEAEVLLNLVLRLLPSKQQARKEPHRMSSESFSGSAQSGPALAWQRVLALEVLRSLTHDADLVRYFWRQYDDGRDSSPVTADNLQNPNDSWTPAGSGLVTKLVKQLSNVVVEDEALLDQQVLRDEELKKRVLDDKPSTTNTLYQAAAGVLGGIKGLTESDSSQHELSVAAVPAMQVLDQLDKSDAPATAPEYPQVLALYALLNIVTCCADEVVPAHGVPSSAGASTEPHVSPVQVPSELGDLPENRSVAYRMAGVLCPPLQSVFTFVIKTRSDDAIFAETLSGWQSWINTVGYLDLTPHRDKLLESLAEFAVPAGVVAAMGSSDSRGLTGRNVAALLAFLRSIIRLSESLRSYWTRAIDAMGAATFVLREHPDLSKPLATHLATFPRPALPFSLAPVIPGTDVPQVLDNVTVKAVHATVAEVTANTAALSDETLTQFLRAATFVSAGGSPYHPATAQAVLRSLELPVPDNLPKRKKPLHALYVDTRGHSIVLPFLVQAWRLNRDRLVRGPPHGGWNIVVSHLLEQVLYDAIPVRVRLQAATLLDELMISAKEQSVELGGTEEEPDAQARIQGQIMRALRCQAVLEYRRATAVEVEIRQLGLESHHRILSAASVQILSGWKPIFDCCYAACSDGPPQNPADSVSTPKGKHYTSPSLVKIGFAVLQQALSSCLVGHLTESEVRMGLDVLGEYMLQHDDESVALLAVSCVHDVVADLDRRSVEDADSKPNMWIHLFSCLTIAPALDDRPQIRSASITATFRILSDHGHAFTPTLWQELLLTILFPLLANLRECQSTLVQQVRQHFDSSRHLDPARHGRTFSASGEAEWSQHTFAESRERAQAAVATRALALQGLGKLLADVSWTIVLSAPEFDMIWSKFLDVIDAAVREGPGSVSQAALDALVSVVQAEHMPHTTSLQGNDGVDTKTRFFQAQEGAWEKCLSLMRDIRTPLNRTQTTLAHLTQENLLSVVRAVVFVYLHTRSSFDLSRLRALFDGLNSLLLYTLRPRRDRGSLSPGQSTANSKLDVDALSPLQAAVRTLVLQLDTSVVGSKALVLEQLAYLASLAFAPGLEASDFSYVALCKACLSDLKEQFMLLHHVSEVYTEGAFVTILRALVVPIQRRYNRPPASAIGEGGPLWHQALIVACTVLRQAIPAFEELSLPPTIVSHAWAVIVEVLECALQPNLDQERLDMRSLDGEVHELLHKDQVFDLVLLSTIENVVLGAIGDESVSEETIDRFGRALVSASSLYDRSSPEQADLDKTTGLEEDWYSVVPGDAAADTSSLPQGVLEPIRLAPRELTAYWMLDLLFLASSSIPQDEPQAHQRNRMSLQLLPLLLERCRNTFHSYAADVRLVGDALPFKRVRTEEVNYLLSKLLEVQTSSQAVERFGASTAAPLPPSTTSRSHLLALYSSFLSLVSLSFPSAAQTQDGRSSMVVSIGEGMSTVGTSVVLSAPPTLPSDLPASLFSLGTVGEVRKPKLSRPDLLAHQCLVAVGGVLGLPVA